MGEVAAAEAQRGQPIAATRSTRPTACCRGPNDHFTMQARTPTGRRVALSAALDAAQRPRGANRARGLLLLRRLQPGRAHRSPRCRASTPRRRSRSTGAVPITDLARTYDRHQPVVVINARTRRRQLIWAELDSQRHLARQHGAPDPPGQEPARGRALHRRPPPTPRRRRCAARSRATRSSRYRDRIRTSDRGFERRRRHMESHLQDARQGGHRKARAVPAWDFTVASARGLSGRLRHIRDDAFRAAR